jgi:hypothetical protein
MMIFRKSITLTIRHVRLGGSGTTNLQRRRFALGRRCGPIDDYRLLTMMPSETLTKNRRQAANRQSLVVATTAVHWASWKKGLSNQLRCQFANELSVRSRIPSADA